MSGRQWKKGDVARSKYGRVLFTERFHETSEEGWLFSSDGSFIAKGTDPDEMRPLVVIDPEDMLQVERLFAAFGGNIGMQKIQNGLRQFVTPSQPKPEEPQNIGAVVVDALGRRYVRGATKCCDQHWTQAAMDHFIGWSDFDAVEVLSEGVTS